MANAQDMKALFDNVTDACEHYGEIDVPARLITGDADSVVPDLHSHAFHEKVQHSTLTILKGVDHMPHHVAVEAVEREMDAVAEGA